MQNSDDQILNNLLSTNLDILSLSDDLSNFFSVNQIKTLGELIKIKKSDLGKLNSFKHKFIFEIDELITRFNELYGKSYKLSLFFENEVSSYQSWKNNNVYQSSKHIRSINTSEINNYEEHKENNLIFYLLNSNEQKSLRRIENKLERKIKIKDLLTEELLTDCRNQRSIGAKTIELIHQYSNPDAINELINSKESRDIEITNDTDPSLIEKKIIENIDYILEKLNEREKFIFSTYYGYKTKVLTLEGTADELFKIENKKRLTRERVRQLILIIKNKVRLNSLFNNTELKNYLINIQSIGFHQKFELLDDFFTDTVKNRSKDITGDRLTQFLADLTNVDYDHYKTPELLLKKDFDPQLLNEIFLELPFGIDEEIFKLELKSLFGFDNDVAKSALKFMDDEKLIHHEKNKIFPLKLNATEEISHIVLKFPKGIYWKDIYEILNNSPSKNSFSMKRLVADYKINSNQNLWLSAKGTHKHLKYLRFKQENKIILDTIIKIFENKKLKTLKLIEVFNSIKTRQLLKGIDIDFYELRALVKIYGKEQGIYWNGKSSVDTISLEKNFKYITQKQNILKIINKSEEAIHESKIVKMLNVGSDISSIVSLHAEQLLNEGKVMRIGPKLWFNYQKSLDMCDINLISEKLDYLFTSFDVVSVTYFMDFVNKELNLAFSFYYYDSLFKILSKKFKLYYFNSYLCKDKINLTSEKIYKDFFNENNDLDENIKNINLKHRIAVSKRQFVNARYYFGSAE